ncbi:MAG: SH3 domain-containing protein [Marinosulfonomonas sp.]|nr:SH3 domain-containing protein [Marinosulfonomonas sp.]
MLCLFGAMYLADNLPTPAPKLLAAAVPDQTVEQAETAPVAAPKPVIVARAPVTAHFTTPRLVLPDGTVQTVPAPVAAQIETAAVAGGITNPPNTVRFVSNKRVNVRAGPSTQFEVVDQVLFADAVEIIGDANGEWVHIRIQGDGVDGYMASRFLQDAAPTQ